MRALRSLDAAWWISAAASAYLMACVWFAWTLTTRHIGFGFLAFLVAFPAAVVGLVCTALVLVGIAPRRVPAAGALVALNCAAAWAIAHTFDSVDRGRDAEFWGHLRDREQVVRMVEAGTLEEVRAPGEPPHQARQSQRTLLLPDGLQHLSSHWRHITVWEVDGATHVMFPQSSTFDSFAGFVYRSDGKPPVSPPGLTFLSEINFSQPLADRWWWAGGVY